MKTHPLHNMHIHEPFRHGLVVSKIWLCEELEKIIEHQAIAKPKLTILGCWNNLLSFMLLTRKPTGYSEITGYDIDDEAINNANKICDTWIFETPKVYNKAADINSIDFVNDSIFINCSVDQIESTIWYDNIPDNSLICIQSTDLPKDNIRWAITQSVNSLDELSERYKMKEILYSGIKNINYGPWGYNRFMIIGYK